MTTFLALRAALESGEARAASPDAGAPTGWRVNAWVKRGILLGFRLGALKEFAAAGLSFVDKDTFPVRHFSSGDGVRVVPGGSSVRAGAYVARSVVCMPPMYINAGAYVDEGTMVDSHALVGSCAQVGKRVHLSAAAQIGGVLETGECESGDHRGRRAGGRQLRRLRGDHRAQRRGAGRRNHPHARNSDL